jgi:CHAT domain-containing protein/tetratricopeptide (TPR) repeat protein
LVGLFQRLDTGADELLAVVPEKESFPIDTEYAQQTLFSLGVPKEKTPLFIEVLRRGGKVVWKERLGPLPWIFVDKFTSSVLAATPDGMISVFAQVHTCPPGALPIFEVQASKDSIRFLEQVLLIPMLAEDIFGRVSHEHWETGPLYRACHRCLPSGATILKEHGAEFDLFIQNLLAADSSHREDILKTLSSVKVEQLVLYLIYRIEGYSSEFGSACFRYQEDIASLSSLAVELALRFGVSKEILGMALLQHGKLLFDAGMQLTPVALEAFAQAEGVFEEPLAKGLATHWQGLSLMTLAKYENAKEAFERSFHFFVQANETQDAVVQILNLVVVSMLLGNYDEAKLWLAKGAELATAVSGPLPSILAESLKELKARVYLVLGDFASAVDIYQDLAKQSKKYLVNAAVVLALIGEYDKAVSTLRGTDDLLRLGQVLMLARRYGAAQACFVKFLESAASKSEDAGECLSWLMHIYGLAGGGTTFELVQNDIDSWLHGRIGQLALCARLYRNRSYSYYLVGDLERAVAACQKAIDLDGQVQDKENLWRDYLLMGLYLEQTGEIPQAIGWTKRAVQEIEGLTAEVTVSELKRFFLAQRRIATERLIDLFWKAGEISSAFPYAERARARSFLDLLATGPVGTLANVAEEGIRTGVVEPDVIEADLQEMIASLPDDTAVLEYFVTEKAVYVWVITRDKVNGPVRLEIDRATLIEWVLAFRKKLEEGPAPGMVGPDLEVLSMARNLYDFLIAPAEERLAGFQHLVIVPSGPLYYLPFATLYRCPSGEEGELYGGVYLMERFVLSYLPSLTTLKYAQTIQKQAHPEPFLLGLANPVHPGSSPLPEACQEAQAIATLFPDREVYCEHEAIEEVLQSRSQVARYLHLSTHAMFDLYNPMYSYLVLTPTLVSDGKLHTYEVFTLPLHADLVVLSACETFLPALKEVKEQVKAARGTPEGQPEEISQELIERITAGDELVGLTQAFICAGTPTVLSSLWLVYSWQTKDLMMAFYQNLVAGMDKAEALRAAQVEVKKLWPHPVYWAAFNLMGDWR